MKFALIIHIVLFICTSFTFGQYKIEYRDEYLEDTIFNLRNNLSAVNRNFYFPSTNYKESDLTSAIELKFIDSSKFSIEGLSEKNISIINLKHPFIINSNNPSLYTRIYTKNISSYSIILHSINGNWFSTSISIDHDGFQLPDMIPISLNNYIDTINTVINKIAITLKKSSPSTQSEFFVGDLIIGFDKEPYKLGYLTLLDDIEIISQNAMQTQEEDCYLKNIYPPILLNNSTNCEVLKNTRSSMNLVPIGNKITEVELLKVLINYNIENYPFYNEKKINKDQIKKEYATLISKIQNNEKIDQAASDIQQFIKKFFFDGHFNIHIPSDKKNKLSKGPIRLYEIDDKFYISAIFDTILHLSLNIGDEVVKIDGDSIITLTKEKEGNEKSLNELLERKSNESAVLTVKREDIFFDVVIKYNTKLIVPSNFKPIHGTYENLSDSIGYFRINNWERKTCIMFLNNWDKLKVSKGLILDLRGSPGGSEYEAIQMFSFFINSPICYANCINRRAPYNKESIIVNPNMHYFYNKPVIILMDNNTACASEVFIIAMRRLNNVKIISKSKSAGSVASKLSFLLPSGIELDLNCMPFVSYEDGIGVLFGGNGIEPDYWVTLNDVKDLYPFNDKLKRIAVKILENK